MLDSQLKLGEAGYFMAKLSKWTARQNVRIAGSLSRSGQTWCLQRLHGQWPPELWWGITLVICTEQFVSARACFPMNFMVHGVLLGQGNARPFAPRRQFVSTKYFLLSLTSLALARLVMDYHHHLLLHHEDSTLITHPFKQLYTKFILRPLTYLNSHQFRQCSIFSKTYIGQCPILSIL